MRIRRIATALAIAALTGLATPASGAPEGIIDYCVRRSVEITLTYYDTVAPRAYIEARCRGYVAEHGLTTNEQVEARFQQAIRDAGF